jgi:rod shape-determining protein MreC
MLPRRRIVTLLVVLCLGHVLLISSQVSTRQGSSVLYVATFGALARVQVAIAGLADGLSGLWTNYVALGGAARENVALRARVLELEGQLQGERARAAGMAGLEDALKLQRSVVAPTVAARVIAGNPVTGVLTVNVDRGTADGVQPNMAVINGKGVVGRVIGRPSARAATVQLLADRTANVGAVLEGSGTVGNVSGGHADGFFRLEMVSNVTPIVVGERVMTSGLEGIYPPGFLIGHVSAVREMGKAREILIAPAVNFARIDVVLIVLARSGAGGDEQR